MTYLKVSEVLKTVSRLECGVCGIVKTVDCFNPSAAKRYKKPSCKECTKLERMVSYRKHILVNLIRLAKHRAAKKGLEFSITPKDIPMPEVCPLLGIPIRVGRNGRAQSDNSPNVDRIDPSKGYIPGNVWIISSRANRIKYNSTITELELITSNLKRLFPELR